MKPGAPQDICCNHGEQIETKLDRILELLEGRRGDRPRGYTLADQFNDLIQRHDKGIITDAQFYKILAEITGIRYPDQEQEIQRFAGRELSAEEAREAEDAGLLVVECTAASDQKPVFLVDGARHPEQGHIVNSPSFQAALEEFRQQHERGEVQ